MGILTLFGTYVALFVLLWIIGGLLQRKSAPATTTPLAPIVVDSREQERASVALVVVLAFTLIATVVATVVEGLDASAGIYNALAGFVLLCLWVRHAFRGLLQPAAAK